VWQDSLRVESVTTKSTHFVALPEYPRNSPHRAAWVSSLNRLFCGPSCFRWVLSCALPPKNRHRNKTAEQDRPGVSWQTPAKPAPRRAPPPHAERPTPLLRCGSLCPSAKFDCRCRTMSAVSTRQNEARPHSFTRQSRATRSSRCNQSLRNQLYSGVCIDRKKGNIAITMNSRVNIASCIVVVSTFDREGKHRPFHYRASLTRNPSHQSTQAYHLSCREHRPHRSLIA
jgi:hypothetical protein